MSKPINLQKKFWSFIKAKKTEGMGVSPLRDAGKLITDPREQAQILNNQFRSVFSPRHTIQLRSLNCTALHSQVSLTFLPAVTSTSQKREGEICYRTSTPTKPCGPDGITPRLLKMIAEEITPALTLLYRNSYNSGTLPLDWKMAYITAVFKKGERYAAVNYRPISLTCIACKLMEHIITSHTMSHLERNKILCQEQLGFRRGRSCET